MTSETYPVERASKALADLKAIKKRSGRLGGGVSLTDHTWAEKDAAIAALRALIEYTGGWDSPKGHPCAIAKEVLDLIDPKGGA